MKEEQEKEPKFIYKVLCRKDTKHVIEFRVKSITSKVITYYPTNRDNIGTKRCRVEDLDVLQLAEISSEIVLNNAFVFTMDKTKIEEYKILCLKIFSNKLQLEIDKLNKSFNDLVQIEWQEKLINEVKDDNRNV